MECPNCGGTIFVRLDYAIIRCEGCMSLFDPFIHPAFDGYFDEIDDDEQGLDDWDIDEDDEDKDEDWDED